MSGRGDLTPAWTPDARVVEESNIARVMREREFAAYEELFAWSALERAEGSRFSQA